MRDRLPLMERRGSTTLDVDIDVDAFAFGVRAAAACMLACLAACPGLAG